jgi:hypothetical protein
MAKAYSIHLQWQSSVVTRRSRAVLEGAKQVNPVSSLYYKPCESFNSRIFFFNIFGAVPSARSKVIMLFIVISEKPKNVQYIEIRTHNYKIQYITSPKDFLW